MTDLVKMSIFSNKNQQAVDLFTQDIREALLKKIDFIKNIMLVLLTEHVKIAAGLAPQVALLKKLNETQQALSGKATLTEEEKKRLQKTNADIEDNKKLYALMKEKIDSPVTSHILTVASSYISNMEREIERMDEFRSVEYRVKRI